MMNSRDYERGFQGWFVVELGENMFTIFSFFIKLHKQLQGPNKESRESCANSPRQLF